MAARQKSGLNLLASCADSATWCGVNWMVGTLRGLVIGWKDCYRGVAMGCSS